MDKQERKKLRKDIKHTSLEAVITPLLDHIDALEGRLVIDEETVRFLTKHRLLDDVYSWADGVLGGYGTEYANRITDEEGRVANVIMQFDQDLKKRWGKAALTQAEEKAKP